MTAVLSRSAENKSGGKLLTVSNRGPVEFRRDEDRAVIAVPGQGGLSTALRVAARLHATTWLSSPMTDVEREIAAGDVEAPEIEGASRFVKTDEEAYNLFYGTFSNEVLWFLQHGIPWPEELDAPRLETAWERGYQAVNRAFAQKVIAEIESGSVSAVMFHDYHFYTAPRMVRAAKPDAYLQHFVHIPWPSAPLWSRLDSAKIKTIVDGLLGNDSLVFQTEESVRNFLLTVKAYLPGATLEMSCGKVTYEGRETRVWANGISVDPEELEEAAESAEFSRYRYLLRASAGHKTIVRVDRLDLTKNVLAGFHAYAKLLEDHPELLRNVQFLAFFIPSRSDIPSYQRYQEETHALVESINARFGNRYWKPIRVFFEHNRMQALAAMSIYDVLLVNPLADGMNLVAKEGPFINQHDGVLVLSKRAGAYEELGVGAVGIDPENVEQTSRALYLALNMPAAERAERAAAMRRVIRGHDLQAWFGRLLSDIEAHASLAQSSAA